MGVIKQVQWMTAWNPLNGQIGEGLAGRL